jgi:hypothetical protein
MKKRVTLNGGGIKNVIRRSLSDDLTISESKIDAIIKEYLYERAESEFMGVETPMEDKTTFSPKSTEALDDMIFGLNEMVDDLDIIKEKEGDVLVETDYYADEYVSTLMESLRDFITNLEHLSNSTKGDDMDYNDEENLNV